MSLNRDLANLVSDVEKTASRFLFKDCADVIVAKGNSGTGTVTFDYTGGSVQSWTATGNHTVAFSNWPSTGNEGVMHLIGTNLGAYTITWPTVIWHKPDGTTTTGFAPYLASNGTRTTLQTSGEDHFIFWCDDASTVHGKLV